MKLNVRKRNGVWAVACDNAILQWFKPQTYGEMAWWEAISLCQFYSLHPTVAEIELGLRNAY